MIEKVKKEFYVLFKELPFMLKEVNKKLDMTRKSEENLFAGIKYCHSYEEFKWKYVYPFISCRAENFELKKFKFDSFLANIIYKFRYTSADNEFKSIYLIVLKLYNKMNDLGEEKFSLEEFLNEYKNDLKNRKMNLIKGCIGISFLTILLFLSPFLLFRLEASGIVMLLAKLFLIGYESIAVMVVLSEFRLSSFKGIDKKIEIIESILKELDVEKNKTIENTYIDKSLKDMDLGKGNEFSFTGKLVQRDNDDVGKGYVRRLVDDSRKKGE